MTSENLNLKMARAAVLAHAQNQVIPWGKIAKNLLTLKSSINPINWNDFPTGFNWNNFGENVTWEDLNQITLFENHEFDHHDLLNKLHYLDLLQEEEISMTLCVEDDFPKQLLDAKPAPPFLFHRGKFEPADANGIAIIGTRKASEFALQIAEEFASQLADLEIPVVSGLASGVDTAALKGSLKRGGRTIAVIGTGIDHYYPPENHFLQDEIAEKGLLISQFLPGASPTKKSFPMRNSIMAAYSSSSLVIQADERSGARLQARIAPDLNRTVFFYEPIMKSETWATEAVKNGKAKFISNVQELIS